MWLREILKKWKTSKSQRVSESAKIVADEKVSRFCRQDIVENAQRIRPEKNSDIIERKGYYVGDGLSKEGMDRAERGSICDGEALDYECFSCGNKFERTIGYGCCPNKWMRKEILENDPTVCPECGSTDVKRVRKGRWLGGEPEEWE